VQLLGISSCNFIITIRMFYFKQFTVILISFAVKFIISGKFMAVTLAGYSAASALSLCSLAITVKKY